MGEVILMSVRSWRVILIAAASLLLGVVGLVLFYLSGGGSYPIDDWGFRSRVRNAVESAVQTGMSADAAMDASLRNGWEDETQGLESEWRDTLWKGDSSGCADMRVFVVEFHTPSWIVPGHWAETCLCIDENQRVREVQTQFFADSL